MMKLFSIIKNFICASSIIGKSKWIFLLLIFPFNINAQCPDPIVSHTNGCGGRVTLHANGPAGIYTWYYNDQGSWTPTGTVDVDFITTISSDTVFAVLYDAPDYSCESNPVFYNVPYVPSLPPGDTSVFGNGVWNVYCYNSEMLQNYAGYYVDTHADLNPELYWDKYESPSTIDSTAFSYQGCYVDIDYHTIQCKKTNFTDGMYQINIIKHDDDCFLYVDGVLIFKHAGYGHGHPNVWRGHLGANSKVEFRWIDKTVNSEGSLSIIPITDQLSIGKMSGDQTICSGRSPSKLSLSQTLYPTNDAYSREGYYSYVTHGVANVNDLTVKTYDSEHLMYSYIAFDISSLPTEVDTALLYLYGYSGGTGSPNIYISVYPVVDTTWTENTIKGDNNPPETPTPLDSTNIYDYVQYTLYSWNVTEYVRQQKLAGAKEITLMLKSNTYSDIQFTFASKERVDNAVSYSLKPYLKVNGPLGGCNIQSYQWQQQNNCNGAWNDISNATSSLLFPGSLTQSNCYRIKVTDVCGNTAFSNSVNINTISSEGGNVVLKNYDNDQGSLMLTGYNGNVVQWEVSEDPSFTNPAIVASNLADFNFTIEKSMYYRALVQVSNCSSDYSEILRVDPFKVYTVITPNGDNENDSWVIDGIEQYPQNNLQIFNRFGNLVYETDGYNNQDKVWKGNSNTGSNEHALPDGTYFYHLEMSKEVKTGYVVIKR